MCLVVVVLLFLTVPWVCLQFVIVVFLDHTHFIKCASFVLIPHVTHIKHVFYHFLLCLFLKIFLVTHTSNRTKVPTIVLML